MAIEFFEKLDDGINKRCTSEFLGDKAIDDFMKVSRFLQKNVELLKSDKLVKRRDVSFNTNINTDQIYFNKETYLKLEKMCNEHVDKKSFIRELNKNYEDGMLNMIELRSLEALYKEKYEYKERNREKED